MKLNLTWHESTEEHNTHYLRVNGVCVGGIFYGVIYTSDKERPWRVSSYLPQGKPFLNRYPTVEEAKKVLEETVNKWFKRFE